MASSADFGAAKPGFSCSAWDVESPLVRVDRTDSPVPSVQLRHLDYPYLCEWDTTEPDINGLFPIANRYLVAANRKLRLPEESLLQLQAPTVPARDGWSLVWMADASDRNHSQWIERHSSGQDRTALLLAGIYLYFAPYFDMFLLGGQGIRILAQVGPPAGGRVTVRITGVVSTVPQLPMGYLTSLDQRNALQRQLVSMAVSAAATVPPGVELVDLGVTVQVGSSQTRRTVIRHVLQARTAPPPATVGIRESMQLDSTSYQLTLLEDLSGGSVHAPRLQPLIAFATRPAQAHVLAQDPVSQMGGASFGTYRPYQPSAMFSTLRSNEPLGNLPSVGASEVELQDAEVWVRHVRLVDPPRAEGTPKVVPASGNAQVRSNEFAAVSAFCHLQSMFSRMRGYGLASASYFRFAALPLDVHYRAGIVPGYGDGRTVNAQVRWVIHAGRRATGVVGSPLQAWNRPATVRRLEMRFALGDVQMAAGRLPANMATALERHPLGVAADARWCWHEFGHVLNAAATGELELPFAHSVGDALAAIACDPGSALACLPGGAADNSGAWRHVTFPWVFIPRRHDRDVQRGWSWTETVAGVAPPHGYRSEQLMSTTLFRLYRALGGDCMRFDASSGWWVPALSERHAAADYTIYLIMLTLSSLGPANVSPCVSVRQFVQAMRTVDCFTTLPPIPGGFVGGQANKVIQSAFERQALYGSPVPGSLVIGPEGQDGSGAPEVDLHIRDRRVQTDGPYTPVDLLGQGWHAAAGAINIMPRFIRVEVQNRGRDAAHQVNVNIWYAPHPGGSIAPPFPGLPWIAIGSTTGNVPGASGNTPGRRLFGPVAWQRPAAGRYYVLVEATCPADRSNIDPATGFPCVTNPGLTRRLVAFDNNLGLAIVEI